MINRREVRLIRSLKGKICDRSYEGSTYREVHAALFMTPNDHLNPDSLAQKLANILPKDLLGYLLEVFDPDKVAKFKSMLAVGSVKRA